MPLCLKVQVLYIFMWCKEWNTIYFSIKIITEEMKFGCGVLNLEHEHVWKWEAMTFNPIATV